MHSEDLFEDCFFSGEYIVMYLVLARALLDAMCERA